MYCNEYEKKCVVIEDGEIIRDFMCVSDCLWSGLFSHVSKDGPIIQFLKDLNVANTIFIIPRSDGNINRIPHDNISVDWPDCVQKYIDYAQINGKKVFVCTLGQINVEKDTNYLYMPLDDKFFQYGCMKVMRQYSKDFVPWEEKSSVLFWRGLCSGPTKNVLDRVRVKFVEKMFEHGDIRFCRHNNYYDIEDECVEDRYFAQSRAPFQEFYKYKIFFIVDGNVIASNHMWAFSTGCVVFMITKSKCWFSDFLIPGMHFVEIKYDMSDLLEKVEWVRNNDREAKRIALNGLDFCELVFSSDFQKKYLEQTIKKAH